MRHIVRKQILEFSLNEKRDAFRIQQQVSEFNSKVILPMLEKAMNELSFEDEVIQLDKIELDLGILQLGEIQNAVAGNNLYEAILAGIKEAILTPASQNGSAVTRKSLRAAKEWLFYMKNGYFDWNMIEINEDWYHHVLEAFAVDFDFVTELRQLILSDQRAVKRIIMQHPDHFLVKLIEILTSENQSRLVALIDELETINSLLYQLEENSVSITRKEIRKKLWEIIITITASPAGKLVTDEIADRVIKKLVNDSRTGLRSPSRSQGLSFAETGSAA